MPSPEPLSDTNSSNETVTFEQELNEVERSLQALKERHQQVQQDQQRQAELGHRREDIRQELRQSPVPELKTELQQVQEELEELEVRLESRLFSWKSLREPFWQIVRFGGLGIVIGWLLAIGALQLPRIEPLPQSTSTPQQN